MEVDKHLGKAYLSKIVLALVSRGMLHKESM